MPKIKLVSFQIVDGAKCGEQMASLFIKLECNMEPLEVAELRLLHIWLTTLYKFFEECENWAMREYYGTKLEKVTDLLDSGKAKAKVLSVVKQERELSTWMYANLPRRSQSSAQEELLKKQGSPYVFGKSCVACIGEISQDEALNAIEKYMKEWCAAK